MLPWISGRAWLFAVEDISHAFLQCAGLLLCAANVFLFRINSCLFHTSLECKIAGALARQAGYFVGFALELITGGSDRNVRPHTYKQDGEEQQRLAEHNCLQSEAFTAGR